MLRGSRKRVSGEKRGRIYWREGLGGIRAGVLRLNGTGCNEGVGLIIVRSNCIAVVGCRRGMGAEGASRKLALTN